MEWTMLMLYYFSLEITVLIENGREASRRLKLEKNTNEM